MPMQTNVTTLGPLVLPVSEQLLFIANLVLRKVFKRKVCAHEECYSTCVSTCTPHVLRICWTLLLVV